MNPNELVSRAGGRRAIIGIGCLYLLVALLWGARQRGDGLSVEAAGLEVLLLAVFGLVLLVGGYRLNDAEIDPAEYPRIAAWTVVSIAVLIWIAALVDLHPDIEMDRTYLSLLLASGVGSVSGLLMGVQEARARTRAREAERANSELEETVAELRRTNERLEDFAGIVSHDLQNPLTVARGNVELAARERSDEHLERAARALDRMDDLTEDLLTMARRGRSVDDPDAVGLATLTTEAWAAIPSGDATLSVETERWIRADERRLQVLMENLLRNAVEHGSTSPRSHTQEDAVDHGAGPDPPGPPSGAVEEGGGTQRAPASGADVGGRRAVAITVGDLAEEPGFYVADDGPGIPDAERGTIFESGYSREPDGTGLGLAIVEEIATAHGWEIVVTASESGGARFEITGVVLTEPRDA